MPFFSSLSAWSNVPGALSAWSITPGAQAGKDGHQWSSRCIKFFGITLNTFVMESLSPLGFKMPVYIHVCHF